MKPNPITLIVIAVLLLSTGLLQAETNIVTQPVPFDGKRAKTLTDSEGNVHLLCNNKGDLFYSRLAQGEEGFSQPVQVNSIPKSAAIGELAVGKGGRVHVVYHGNIHYVRSQMKEKRKLNGADIKYTFYSRMNDSGTAFEGQRDISANVWGFDGGCTIAADGDGGVYVFMGGVTKKGKETDRRVYLTVSNDGGDEFAEPRPIDLGKGVCMCCHLKAQYTASGSLMLAYRVAEDSVNRDSYLLTSEDQGTTFKQTALDQWQLRACPGGAYSFVNVDGKTLVSWRNKEDVYFGSDGDAAIKPEDKKLKRRMAVLGKNARGEVLMAWAEGENFNKPHHLRRQLYDKEGKALGTSGSKQNAFERWGNASIYAKANGDFVILH